MFKSKRQQRNFLLYNWQRKWPSWKVSAWHYLLSLWMLFWEQICNRAKPNKSMAKYLHQIRPQCNFICSYYWFRPNVHLTCCHPGAVSKLAEIAFAASRAFCWPAQGPVHLWRQIHLHHIASLTFRLLIFSIQLWRRKWRWELQMHASKHHHLLTVTAATWKCQGTKIYRIVLLESKHKIPKFLQIPPFLLNR